MAPRRYKSITRVDQPEKHTHGWYVRVRFQGKELTRRFFSDRRHGGKRKSLQKAIEHRDAVERKHGKPRTERAVVARRVRRQSEVPGVRYTIRRTRSANGAVQEHPVYEVTWSPEPNITQRTTVSVRKYGKREAFRRALAIRREKEKKHYGGVITEI